MLVSATTSKILRSIALFEDCGARELRLVDRLSTSCMVDAGKVLCHEGDAAREFFVIVAGEATVSVEGTTVARLGAGSFFGEMALLDGGGRAATVTALSAMELRVFSAREFATLMREVPRVMRRIAGTMSSRLRLADRLLAAKASTP